VPLKKAEDPILLVDTNIFVYATGIPEREKAPQTRSLEEACRQIILALGQGRIRAVTHLAVLQEILYLFARWARERRAPGLYETGRKAAENALALVEGVLTPTLVEFARALEGFDPRSEDFNDRLIVEGMKAHTIERILTADGRFARHHGINVLDPLTYVRWRAP